MNCPAAHAERGAGASREGEAQGGALLRPGRGGRRLLRESALAGAVEKAIGLPNMARRVLATAARTVA